MQNVVFKKKKKMQQNIVINVFVDIHSNFP